MAEEPEEAAEAEEPEPDGDASRTRPRSRRPGAEEQTSRSAYAPTHCVRRYLLDPPRALRRPRRRCVVARALPRADARPRPPGRPRGRAPGAGAERAGGDGRGPRPLGRDHPRPRRQARRLRARDPQAGRRTRSSSSSPASTTRPRAAEIVGKTAQLEFYDLEADLVPLVERRERQPGASPTLLPLLTAGGRAEGGDDRREWYLFGQGRAPSPGRRRRRQELLAAARGRQGARRASKFYAVPRRPDRPHVRPANADGLPAASRRRRAAQTYYYLFKYQPNERRAPDPGDDGRGPQARRHARRTSTADRPADRRSSSSRTRAATSSTTSRGARAARASPAQTQFAGSQGRPGRASSTSRSCSTARSARSRSIDFNDPNPDGIAGGSAQITRPRLDPGGEGSRARPPDRRPARRVRPGRAHGHLRDARRGLAPPGAHRRHRRPPRRRALPAPLLPLPRPRRDHRARRSTASSSTAPSSSST